MWKRRVIIFIIAFVLFLIPNLLWGNLYMVGGDDSRLYYIFPQQYLQNYALNIISNNTLGGNLGYLAVSYVAPILLYILIIKTLFYSLNTQFLVYGSIFASGFIFFYLFIQAWIEKKSHFSFVASIVVSLVYVLSPYVTGTFWQHQLLSIFLIMVTPGCLYLFIKGVKEQKNSFVIASALLYGALSETVYSLPWFLGVAITLVPLALWLATRYMRRFIASVLLFLVVFVSTNIYWLIHYILPFLFSTGETHLASTLLTEDFRRQNSGLIEALTYLNGPVHQITQYLRTSWDDRQGLTLGRSLGGVLTGVIALAGMHLKHVRKTTIELYLLASVGFGISLICITPNFGAWNLSAFQYASFNIPFFSMFRNMDDKFALAMAFNTSFVLFASFIVLYEAKIKRIYVWGMCAVVVVVILALSWARMYPSFDESKVSTRIGTTFNADFRNLTQYMSNMETGGRFLWLPMTFSGHVYVSDQEHPGHFYVGRSPIQFLTNNADLSGFYGIQTSFDSSLNWTVFDLLKNGSFDEVSKVLQRQNISYIIVNHETLPNSEKLGVNAFGFVDTQTQDFYRMILGKKIADFGSRYSLYHINQRYFAPTIFLTHDIDGDVVVDQVPSFRKLANGKYETTITVHEPTRLVLQEPYNNLWKMELVRDGVTKPLPLANTPSYRYGNSWEIDSAGLVSEYPAYVSNGVSGYSMKLNISFWPNVFIAPTIGISILSALFWVMYISIPLILSRIRRKTHE